MLSLESSSEGFLKPLHALQTIKYLSIMPMPFVSIQLVDCLFLSLTQSTVVLCVIIGMAWKNGDQYIHMANVNARTHIACAALIWNLHCCFCGPNLQLTRGLTESATILEWQARMGRRLNFLLSSSCFFNQPSSATLGATTVIRSSAPEFHLVSYIYLQFILHSFMVRVVVKVRFFYSLV